MSGTGILGGATKSILNVIREVTARQHEAIIICPDKEGFYKFITEGNIPGARALNLSYTYSILPSRNNLYDYIIFVPRLIKRIIKNYFASKKLEKICKEEQIDIIHSNTSVNNIGYRVAKKLEIPHIWHIREYGWLDFKMIVPFQKRMFRASCNFTISITKDIARYKKLSEDYSHRIIYNGICDEKSFRINPIPAEYFLYAGNVSEKKGIFDLLEAYCAYIRASKSKIVRLLIAGTITEEMQRRIRVFSENNGISDRIDVLGPRNDIADLMFNSKAVIVPSLHEGFGRVIPEAMSNGCITIGRNTGGTKEQYDNGLKTTGQEIGFRFNTIEELTSILKEVGENDKSNYIGMIQRSQEVVRELYTNKISALNVLKFYDEILHEAKQ